jgi:hypothetical protein
VAPPPTHVAADFDARVENKELKTRMRPVENSDAWRVRTALRLSSARGCALALLEFCIHRDTQCHLISLESALKLLTRRSQQFPAAAARAIITSNRDLVAPIGPRKSLSTNSGAAGINDLLHFIIFLRISEIIFLYRWKGGTKPAHAHNFFRRAIGLLFESRSHFVLGGGFM